MADAQDEWDRFAMEALRDERDDDQDSDGLRYGPEACVGTDGTVYVDRADWYAYRSRFVGM